MWYTRRVEITSCVTLDYPARTWSHRGILEARFASMQGGSVNARSRARVFQLTRDEWQFRGASPTIRRFRVAVFGKRGARITARLMRIRRDREHKRGCTRAKQWRRPAVNGPNESISERHSIIGWHSRCVTSNSIGSVYTHRALPRFLFHGRFAQSSRRDNERRERDSIDWDIISDFFATDRCAESVIV